MKKIITAVLIILFSLGAAQAIGTSASYKLAADVVDAGGRSGSSNAYKLIGKTRDHNLSTPASSNFIIGEGFLRSSYYGQVIFAPIVTSVLPATGANSSPITLEVSGTNFATGASVKLSVAGQSDIVATNVVLLSSSKISGTFNITGAKVGLWTMTVTNTDGRSGSLPAAFQVLSPAPMITAITPAAGYNNATVEITNLAGSNFRSGATVKLTKTGENDIPGTNVTVVSAEKITCRFDLNGKATGQWDVVVTNDDNQSGTLSAGFKVEAEQVIVTKPVESSQNPFNPTAGATALKYSLSRDYEITVNIFNIRGERVWTYRAMAGADGGKVGENQVRWDGITGFKASAPSGVYFVRVTAVVDGTVKTLSTTKIALIR